MRILVLLPGNDVGGAERAAAQVAGEAVRRGHDVLVGTGDITALAFGLEELPSVQMPVHPERKWLALAGARSICAARPDVIYTYHRWTTLVAGIARMSCGAPVVVHAQTKRGHRFGTWWGNYTIAVSEAMRDHVIRCGADPRRTVVIRNGALPRVPPARSPTTRIRLVSAARLVEGKGIEHVICALSDLPETELAVVGEGPQRKYLETLARDSAVSERVEFVGWVPDPWEAFVKADIGIVPTSTYPEGLPLVAIEMMMAGLPVVVTDVPGLREIADASTVRLVEPGKASTIVAGIESLLGQDLRSIGQAAHTRALRHYNAYDMARMVVNSLEQVANVRI